MKEFIEVKNGLIIDANAIRYINCPEKANNTPNALMHIHMSGRKDAMSITFKDMQARDGAYKKLKDTLLPKKKETTA